MTNNDAYQPKPKHKFSFGLWTLGNRGRDPFGDFVRPVISPAEIVAMLGEVGAWGVNLHDNDLVPIDATPAERDALVRERQRFQPPRSDGVRGARTHGHRALVGTPCGDRWRRVASLLARATRSCIR